MKALIATLALAFAALTVTAQGVKQNTFTTGTNGAYWPNNGLTVGCLFVDAVSGSDTNAPGRGGPDLPYATLTFAQSNAVSGNTIIGVRGTFAETMLGKNGVSWFFNDGVWLTQNATFVLGATNGGCTNLVVGGRVSTTNAVVALYYATNTTVAFDAKYVSCSTTTGFIYDWTGGFSLSNRVYLTTDIFEFGAVVQHAAASVSNDCNEYYVTGRQRLTIKPEATTGAGHSNTLVVLKAPRVHGAAGASSQFFAALDCVQVKADWFTKAAAMTLVQSNYWFDVNVLTTNDLNTNIAGLKGLINVVR